MLKKIIKKTIKNKIKKYIYILNPNDRPYFFHGMSQVTQVLSLYLMFIYMASNECGTVYSKTLFGNLLYP